jgi:hypothetical protein
MFVQRQEDLPVWEPRRELVRGVHRERGPFKLCPAKEDTAGLAHAASRSLADK